MFDDEIDDYRQKIKKRTISRRDLAVKECNSVTGVETVQNFKKLETLVVIQCRRNAKERRRNVNDSWDGRFV